MTRHFGGPISKVLSEIEATTTEQRHYKRKLVERFCLGFGRRNPVFQMKRFVIGCGYSQEEATEIIEETWNKLSDKDKRDLKRAMSFARVGRAWWHDGERRD